MTAPFPDNAWLTYAEATARWGAQTSERQAEYLRHDTAALASSEVVQALIGAVLEEAANAVPQDLPYGKADGELMRGRAIGYKDAAFDAQSAIRALRPDATAELARMLREARNAALEEAARIVDPPLMHRKGRIGLWRQRLVTLAERIRALKEQPE